MKLRKNGLDMVNRETDYTRYNLSHCNFFLNLYIIKLIP